MISESNVFKIPIEKYEEDMEKESAKEKKEEILDLLINYNNLHSEEEFKEIEYLLHIACKNGDLELIKIYLCERMENDSKDMIFKVDKTNKTASLFKINKNFNGFTVPRTVEIKLTEYLITSICGTGNDIKIIKFVEDSAVRTIYNHAFSYALPYSNIKEIYFPESLKELKEGWCEKTKYLTKIKISPSNKKFICKDDKYLLCKSDENKDEFDLFLFASRDINEISIPPNIIKICDHAFEYCKNLTKVEIPTNSKLEIIESSAFSYSKINEISIPSTVTKICDYVFFCCDDLTKVEIPTNSKLEIIGSFAFLDSKINEIYFPESLKELKRGWCSKTKYLTKIKISPSNKKFIFKNKYLLCKSDESRDEFDLFLFASRDINEISIPPNIIKICDDAFGYCKNLTKVEIPTNSKLEIIESSAFSCSKINEISIPSTVTKICDYAFFFCEDLTKVEIPTNSKLEIIEKNAFQYSKINEIYFPESLKELKRGWCSNTKYLTKIKISPFNKKFNIKDDKYLLCKSDESRDEFDLFLFASRDINEISIPSTVTKICEYAFGYCKNLTKVEIPTNSKLEIIESSAFQFSKINEISIPSTVTKICDYVFFCCEDLTKVEIPTNSKLEIIEKNAFSDSKINEIYFPESLKELKEGWCSNTKYLTKIKISPFNKKFNIKDDKYLLCKSDESRDEFDLFLFASRDIKKISIPPNIIKICDHAFEYCKNLTKVEIPTNSKLEIIELSAFSYSKINEISIPSTVTKICDYAFRNCEDLTKVEIPVNSNLEIIESSAFSESKLKQIFIPSKISKSCGYSFHECKNFIKVEIPTNSRSSDNFINKELLILPHIDIPVDLSAILSLSIYNTNITIITRDYKAIVYNEYEKCFEENTIKNHDKVFFPISGFKNSSYDLYIVSEVENGIRTYLVKNNNFLNIGSFNPVSIFGGSTNCAAIDLNGAILYIPSSFNESNLIEPKYLPNNEKAVDIACLSNFLYVLSSNGKLYMSKNVIRINFIQVEQFKNTNIIQISGILDHILALTKEGKVYAQGTKLYGELGTRNKKSCLKKFIEIISLNQYKIIAVSAGQNHSLFLTTEGKVLACGYNRLKQCFTDNLNISIVSPIETSIQNSGLFCISSYNSAAVCIGFDPENSPNRRVKDEINIVLFGCKTKTQILQAFINNKFVNKTRNDDEHNDDDNDEDYIVDLEIHEKVVKLRLIEAKDINDFSERNNYYHRSMNFIYFIDNLDQSTSFKELDQIYEEAKQVWKNNAKFVLVNCIDSNSTSSKLIYNKITSKYKCEIFDVNIGKDIKKINKAFYSFLPDFQLKDILKVGKDYHNPFNNINKDHLNIGLFGNKEVNKTELAFRYVYGDLYKIFYDDFIENYAENSLDKIVECQNKYFEVSILDSTFVNDEEDDDNFSSYYSAVQGIVLVFQIDLLSSEFMNEINHFYEKVKGAVNDEINLIIALSVEENEQINDLYQINADKIIEIEKTFNCKVILFSNENGESVEYLFYILIKKIVDQNKKQRKKPPKKRKHPNKKKSINWTKWTKKQSNK